MFPSEITELYHRYNGAANLRQAVVFFVLGGPLLVDLVRRQDGGDAGPAAHRMIPYFYNSTTVIPAPEANGDGAHEDARREGGAAAANKDRGAPEGSNAAATGCMDRSGRFAFVGSVKGELSVVDLDSLAVMDHIQCCETKLRIMHIHMSSRNDRILVNGYDRMLRVCSVDVEGMARAGGAGGRGLLTLVQTFKNSIENFAWGNCSFSHDCRYVIGSPTVKTGETHQLHVFNCSSGNFECVLEGPPESVTHIEYHPHSPIMLSLSSSGDVYVWAKNYTEKWSAFAPDFRELDENEEYVEREDEFDLAPHDPRLLGDWELVGTTSEEIAKRSGMTGLGAVPFTSPAALFFSFRSDGSCVAKEVLQFFGRPVMLNELRGKYGFNPTGTMMQEKYVGGDCDVGGQKNNPGFGGATATLTNLCITADGATRAADAGR